MGDEQADPEIRRRLDSDDPLDRIEPDEGDDDRVEQAWEDSDVADGEAPSG